MFRRIVFSVFFFLFDLAVVCSMAATPSVPGGNSTEFIRDHCAATRYPDLCFRSLRPYAGVVQQDACKLAAVATNVTLRRIRSFSRRVEVLRSSPAAGKDKEVSAALDDCSETLRDAVDLARRTEEELKRLESAAGPEVAWRVSNAQTWMSAALTDEDTCNDSFDGVRSPNPVKDEILQRVQQVEQYTSNALAIINSLVSG